MEPLSPASDPIQAVLNRLEGVRGTGSYQWQARCPAHDDKHASLSLGRGDDGRALLHCHAGCALADVLKAIGISGSELFPLVPTGGSSPQLHRPSAPASAARQLIIATYRYRNTVGDLLYEVVRREPKGFQQRRPDGKGGWIWSMKDVPRVLYRLPELLAADKGAWVFVCEGEKDVDNLAALGLVATTNPGGAAKWGKLVDDSALYGRRVAILADKDAPGLAHAQDVATRLHGKAAVVRIIDLPNMPAKADGRPRKDVSDWIEWLDGKTAGELVATLVGMAEAAPTCTAKAEAPAFAAGPVLVCMADVEPREVRWLWPGRVPLGSITVLSGRPGEGKSFLTTDMAARVTKGIPWPDGGDCPAGSVIFISAEDDPHQVIRPRLDAHNADVHKVHLLSAVRHVGKDGQFSEVMFTLADVASLESALKACPDCQLIVVDPIGSFLGGKTDAHRDNEVRSVLAPVARLAEKYGPAVVVVAHKRKSAGSIADDLVLGSRAFTGIARAVWHLTRDSDERRLLLPGKNNLAPEGTGLAFSIAGKPGAVVWERDPVAMSADDALAAENGDKQRSKPGPEPEGLNQATDWLAAELADMLEHPVKTVKDDAQAAGLGWRSVQRASTKLGVKVHRAEFGGGCVWRLLAPVSTTHLKNGELGTNGTNVDLKAKTDTTARHERHTCQDDSLGVNVLAMPPRAIKPPIVGS